MSDDSVSAKLGTGKKKYRATFRQTVRNPFRGRGMIPGTDVQEVEMDADVPFDQVKAFALEVVKEGTELVSLEEIN